MEFGQPAAQFATAGIIRQAGRPVTESSLSLPRLTQAVPSPLICILVLTGITMAVPMPVPRRCVG